ncbi:MAG TPA: phage holin family protein [bacterium]|nr:phage holin family protein [bacterium]HPN30310.1 phage holin family protein [bacterium]
MSLQKNSKPEHIWRFNKIGGFEQVRIETGDDIKNIPYLDQKLWVALNCPVKGVEFDKTSLSLLDSDNDGNIKPNEIINAINWVCGVLKNPDVLINNNGSLDLSDFNQDTEEGKTLFLSAKHILDNLDKKDSKIITIDDASDTMKIFEKTRFNGDGIINSDSSDNPEIKKIIEEIIFCCGSEIDKAGKPGISIDILEKFFSQTEAYLNWNLELEKKSEILPPMENLLKEIELFDSLKAKIDDYFIRCNLIDFDKNSESSMNSADKIYSEFIVKQLNYNCAEIKDLPISLPNSTKILNLKSGINPLWREKIEEFYNTIITPILGEIRELTFEQWQSFKYKFSIFEEILNAKPDSKMIELGLNRVREIVNCGNDYKNEIMKLIEKDKEFEPQANAIISVNKLLRLCRDLHPALNNFVSFEHFYNPEAKAIFQSGTLFIDGRSCDLCVSVEDAAKHALLAGLSRAYLLYCDCVRRDGTPGKITIAAAVTAGDAGQLMPGRNGIYYDRTGCDWNATVVKIIENPISIKQAFWSPYRAVAKMITSQIQKFAASKSKSVEDKMGAGIEETGKKIEQQKIDAPQPAKTPSAKTEPAPVDMGKFVGIFAAIGLALGAIGTAVASIVTGLLALKWWQAPLAVGGVMLLISGPAMIIAYFKLKERNLAPILDSNGWAINSRVKINIPFGTSLTKTAKLPVNSERIMSDPFEIKKSKWHYYLLIIWIIAVVIYLKYKNII